MEEREVIAEIEAKKVWDWYLSESDRIDEKYKEEPGMDKGTPEHRELIDQAYQKMQEIRKKHGL